MIIELFVNALIQTTVTDILKFSSRVVVYSLRKLEPPNEIIKGDICDRFFFISGRVLGKFGKIINHYENVLVSF